MHTDVVVDTTHNNQHHHTGAILLQYLSYKNMPVNNPPTPRRRIEWPTQDEHIRRCLTEGGSSPTKTVSQQSKAVIDEELSKCDTRAGCSTDLCVFDELYVRSPDWRGVLRNLYWRARRQSAIWDVFEFLVNRGFIDPSCLTIPVKLGTLTRDAGMLSALLDCFEFPAQDSLDFAQGTIPLQPPEWNMDTAWYVLLKSHRLYTNSLLGWRR